MFLKLSQCQIIWYLFAHFSTIILCFVHSVWFVKYVFSAKIWFLKASTKIVKYESPVLKLNPGDISKQFLCMYQQWWIEFISSLECFHAISLFFCLQPTKIQRTSNFSIVNIIRTWHICHACHACQLTEKNCCLRQTANSREHVTDWSANV